MIIFAPEDGRWGMGAPFNTQKVVSRARAKGPRDRQLHFVERNARKRAHEPRMTSGLYILSPALPEHSWICLR